MLKLYESGKSKNDIIAEYDLTPTAFNTWIKRNQTTGSFQEKDNRSPEENELIRLRKENQQLKMDNDILKQAETTMVQEKSKLSLKKQDI